MMKHTSLTLATLIVAAMASAAVVPAYAENGRNAAAIGGLAAGAVIGGAIAGSRPGYGPPPTRVYEEVDEPVCHIQRQAITDPWGNVVRYRRVRVCE